MEIILRGKVLDVFLNLPKQYLNCNHSEFAISKNILNIWTKLGREREVKMLAS